METKEIIANSEVVEKTVEEAATAAVEKLANVNSGSTAKIAVGFGVGVLAGVVVCKFIAPVIGRKLTNCRAKYVKYTPVEEQPPEARENNEPPAEEHEDKETGENPSEE